VLRQNKCSNFEAPFLYLLIGNERAFLLDTGARSERAGDPLISRVISDLLDERPSDRRLRQMELIVAHSHGHGDHAFGDAQFAGKANTTVVPTSLTGLTNFFGIEDWPGGSGKVDLGGRVLTILPIPGHEDTHIAIYDHNTAILLTGDTLYPGLLTVRDWPAYRQSAMRLASFAQSHRISLVLGAHVEMSKTPGIIYPIGTTFQSDEHPLPLMLEDLREWSAACAAMGEEPRREVHDSFIIEPVAGSL
jgi:glyoxylase-like metal-dependent hydrolase (beta-lactamase superfamily II)